MTNNTPRYVISSEEFVQDYLTLPDNQKLMLFKLRMAYSMKGSCLTWDDILAVCPALSDEAESDRQKVLKRFFHNERGFWIDDRVELSLKQKFDQEAYKQQQAAFGRLGAKKRWSKDNPNGYPNGNPNSYPIGNPNSNPNGNPNSYPNGNPNSNPNGDPNSYPIGNPNGDPNSYPNGNPNSNPNGDPNSYPNGNPIGYPNEDPNGSPNGLPSNSFGDKAINSLIDNDSQNGKASASASPSHVRVGAHAGTHAITRTSDSDDNTFINKNNKSESDAHAHLHARKKQEKPEDFNDIFDENQNATLDDLTNLLTASGMNNSAVRSWLPAADKTRVQRLIEQLPQLGKELFDEVIETCKKAKAKSNQKVTFDRSVAFVFKALESKIESIQKTSEIDYTEGLIRQPDGSYRPAPRRRRS